MNRYPARHRAARSRAFAPDPDAPGRPCDIPGCPCQGEYKAPKSRTTLNEYWWFCLDHVRAYNAGWDYYRGMTPGQIEAQLRADTHWQRPSWPLGRLGGRAFDEAEFLDPMRLLERRGHKGAKEARITAPAELREPLATLELVWPVTLDEVKLRYKELAKRHHPDANGGDKQAEERLKTINLAYAAVKRGLSMEPAVQTS